MRLVRILLLCWLIGRSLPSCSASTESVPELATQLQRKATSERQKLRNIFDWVTKEISYDVAAFRSGAPSNLEPEDVLHERKAVCAGYAKLFVALCQEMKIEAMVVAGYAKGFGYKPGERFLATNHDWVIAKADGQWVLIDPTWGAGNVTPNLTFERMYKPSFFGAAPHQFVLTHLPVAPAYQLLPRPIDYQDFYRDTASLHQQLLRPAKPTANWGDTLAYISRLNERDKNLYDGIRSEFSNAEDKQTVGFAWLNYAFNTFKAVRPTIKEDDYEAQLALQVLNLECNQRALRYLGSCDTEPCRQASEVARNNIDQAKSSVKALRSLIRYKDY